MSSSYEKIVGEQARDTLILWLCLTALLTLSVVVIAVALSLPNKGKIINSYGLILDITGVIFASYTIVFPPKKKAKKGTMYLSNMPQFRPQVIADYSEKHGLKLQIGVLIISYGFIMQLLSNWV